jgi:hypothetical protein
LPPKVMTPAVTEERRERGRVRERGSDILFDEPPVMPDPESRHHVDQAM